MLSILRAGRCTCRFAMRMRARTELMCARSRRVAGSRGSVRAEESCMASCARDAALGTKHPTRRSSLNRILASPAKNRLDEFHDVRAMQAPGQALRKACSSRVL